MKIVTIYTFNKNDLLINKIKLYCLYFMTIVNIFIFYIYQFIIISFLYTNIYQIKVNLQYTLLN